MTANVAAGWALIASVVIGIVASLPTPGGLIIDPADTARFSEAAGVLGDNFSLAQTMTFLLVVSISLYWFLLVRVAQPAPGIQRQFTHGPRIPRLER